MELTAALLRRVFSNWGVERSFSKMISKQRWQGSVGLHGVWLSRDKSSYLRCRVTDVNKSKDIALDFSSSEIFWVCFEPSPLKDKLLTNKINSSVCTRVQLEQRKQPSQGRDLARFQKLTQVWYLRGSGGKGGLKAQQNVLGTQICMKMDINDGQKLRKGFRHDVN